MSHDLISTPEQIAETLLLASWLPNPSVLVIDGIVRAEELSIDQTDAPIILTESQLLELIAWHGSTEAAGVALHADLSARLAEHEARWAE